MLNQEEKDFLVYWEKNRERQKKRSRQLLLGIPAGLLFVVPMILNLASRWDKRAEMVSHSSQSFNPYVILFGFLLISVFIAIFSKRFAWERKEQRYQELKARESKESPVK